MTGVDFRNSDSSISLDVIKRLLHSSLLINKSIKLIYVPWLQLSHFQTEQNTIRLIDGTMRYCVYPSNIGEKYDYTLGRHPSGRLHSNGF